MSYLNKALKNFSGSVIWNIAGQGINFFILIYLPRVLGPDGYGIFNYVQSYITYFFLLSDLGLSLLCIREVNQNVNKEEIVNKIYNLKFYISIFSTVVFYSTIVFAGKSIEEKLTMMAIGVSVFLTGTTIDYLFNAFSNMKISSISIGVKNFVFGVLCFLCVKNKNDVYIVSIAYTISILVGQAFLLINFNRKYFKLKIKRIVIKDFKILKLALPLSVGTFMVQINNNFDIVYLSFFKSDKEVGYYSAAYKIINFLVAIVCIYFNAAYPVIAQMLKSSRNELNRFIEKFYSYGAMIVIPIVFGGIALNDKIINFLFGNKYNPSIILFSILLPLVFIRIVTSTYGAVLIMGEGSKEFSKGVMIGAIINIILNVMLTPKYGAKGSAMATLICESVQGVYLFVQYKRYCDGKFVFSNIKFLVCSSIMFCVLICVRLNLILSILVGIFVYFIVLYVLTLIANIIRRY